MEFGAIDAAAAQESRGPLLDCVHERLQALDADFEAVAGFNRSDAAGCAGKDDVAGEQGHVGGNECDQIVAIEDELAGVGILTELTILKKLDGEVVRVDLGFHIRAERGEGVKRFATGPLAFGLLNSAVANVLGGGITKNVAGGGGGRDVAAAPANDDGQFGFVISAVCRKWNFDLRAIGYEGSGGFEPKERFFGERFAGFARVIGIIESNGDNLCGGDRGEGSKAFEGSGFFVERGRTEDVTTQSKQLAINDFSVENFITLLKSPDSSHKCGQISSKTINRVAR